MKKFLVFAGLLLAAPPLAASSEALDPKEPVTLDLRDAKLTDVITTLGAMANLTVVIEPGIEGKVTLQAERVPFDRILEILSRQNGFSLRREGGKLVASRVREAPVAAPALAEQFRDAPRILLSEYSTAAASPPPVLIKTSWNGEEKCWIARIGNAGGGLLEIPLASVSTVASAPVTGEANMLIADMGYDPVLRTRTLAVEAAGGAVKRAFTLGAKTNAISFDRVKEGESMRVFFSHAPGQLSRPDGQCADAVFRSARGTSPVTVTMQAAALSERGASTPVFAPRIQTTAGTVFKTLGSDSDSGEGQLRGYAVTGYVSRDGKSVALAFKARAVWTDPEDGKQYYFTQGDNTVDFVPLMKSGVLASTMQPGVATARALELRVFGDE